MKRKLILTELLTEVIKLSYFRQFSCTVEYGAFLHYRV